MTKLNIRTKITKSIIQKNDFFKFRVKHEKHKIRDGVSSRKSTCRDSSRDYKVTEDSIIITRDFNDVHNNGE